MAGFELTLYGRIWVTPKAIRLAGNWSRFSFCWDTFLYKRRNATWAASSDSATPSMIGLGWSRAPWSLSKLQPASQKPSETSLS
jgi:hypothetical protein